MQGKLKFSSAAIVALSFLISNASQIGGALTENEMRVKLSQYNEDIGQLCYRRMIASWNVATDIGNSTKEKEQQKRMLELQNFFYNEWQTTWRIANIDDYQDEIIKRQLSSLKQLGFAALSKEDSLKFSQVITNMSTIYSSATVCKYRSGSTPDCSEQLTLDPEITERIANSRDSEELKYYWTEWRRNSGKRIREYYPTYVTLLNRAAVANGFANGAEYWKSIYEDKNFVEKVDALWEGVKPLYDVLHTYMKYKLMEIYGDKIDRQSPYIPAHLLGNQWAQSWGNLYDDIKPFQNASLVDVTAKLKEKNYSAKRMFEIADEFYTSLGLPTNVVSFTGESIINKPKDRIIQCHPSAWDFCNGVDFRIKMCTNINMEDFLTIHHEMGHIQYYIQYKDLPLTLQGGANPGFHEAIGDAIALSVATPQHLQKIGLLNNYKDSVEDNINALLRKALERVAFLPFGLLIDKWRWDVFSGNVQENQWNHHWWHLREKYQKVTAPTERSENDFDAGAKYHVPDGSQYIAYFVARLLEFQFYKALCIEAGEYDPNDPNTKPLHKCDFYQSKAAGKKLADGMKLGASKHWSEVLRTITGESEINSSAFLEYFKPLQEFLTVENQRLQKEDELRQQMNAEKDAYANVPIYVGTILGCITVLLLISYCFYKKRSSSTNDG